VLLVLSNLKNRSGMVLHVRDIAGELLRRGHAPIVYSPLRGVVADELRRATIAVPETLDRIDGVPDIIHGHSHLETMVAMLRYPQTPAVATCHGFESSQNAAPPLFPRIRRYVPVDHACRDRLILECGIPRDRISVQLNFVDLERFPLRGRLPPRPGRAVVFGRDLSPEHLSLIGEVCQNRDIALDILGGRDQRVADPGSTLGQYDMAFAKGRSAIEALASGLAVVICGPEGLGSLVTSANYGDLRPLNFGLRTLRQPVTATMVQQAVDAYDPVDAGEVSSRIRGEAGLKTAVDDLVELYRTVIREHRCVPSPPHQEGPIVAAYLEEMNHRYRNLVRTEAAAERQRTKTRLAGATSAREQNLQARIDKALSERAQERTSGVDLKRAFAQTVARYEGRLAELADAASARQQILQARIDETRSERAQERTRRLDLKRVFAQTVAQYRGRVAKLRAELVSAKEQRGSALSRLLRGFVGARFPTR
jgi:hypothetical protein